MVGSSSSPEPEPSAAPSTIRLYAPPGQAGHSRVSVGRAARFARERRPARVVSRSPSRPIVTDVTCGRPSSPTVTRNAAAPNSEIRSSRPAMSTATLMPPAYGRSAGSGDPLVHVRRRLRPPGVVAAQARHREAGVGHQPVDGPVEVAAAEDQAVDRLQPVLPAHDAGLWR